MLYLGIILDKVNRAIVLATVQKDENQAKINMEERANGQIWEIFKLGNGDPKVFDKLKEGLRLWFIENGYVGAELGSILDQSMKGIGLFFYEIIKDLE